jgi:hypothetical protein
MTTVGFIGSGNLGGTVARLAVAAAYDVVLSNSRGPQTLTELVEEFGAARGRPPRPRRRQRASWWCEHPAAGLPGGPRRAAGRQAGLDTTDYVPQRDGPIPGLADGSPSSSEVLQRHWGARTW